MLPSGECQPARRLPARSGSGFASAKAGHPIEALLAFPDRQADFLPMDDTPHIAPDTPHPELAPPGTPPHIAVAPGVLDDQHVVIRDEDDTDESYQSRCELVALMLDYAAKQD
jgi:hypothetical protein